MNAYDTIARSYLDKAGRLYQDIRTPDNREACVTLMALIEELVQDNQNYREELEACRQAYLPEWP